jgi:O-Antigen ligase
MLRLTTEAQENWYRASFAVPERLELGTGELSTVKVTVTNTGLVTWQPADDPPFLFSYHWLDEGTDRVVLFDGLRTEFPSAVPPGTSITLDAFVEAPAWPGRYRLAWDVVLEDRLWFSTERDAPASSTSVEVKGSQSVSAARITRPRPTPAVRVSRGDLWKAAGSAFLAHPLLGVGPDNFRLVYGRYAGLSRFDQRIHTNNMYLEFLVGGGVVALAALAWLMWRIARTLHATARQIDDNRRWLLLGIAAALTAVAVHGLVDSFLTFTPTYLAIALTLGMLIACTRSPEADSHANRV